jgi:Na+-transporting methylmalonyl-CoA/oxaloacetate decarboxylase gamma subunit
MDASVPELLRQGLIITAIGMTLVFAVLGLLWGIMALLTRVFREAAPDAGLPQGGEADAGMIQASVIVEVGIVEALTVERARVAAIVAGALMANAVPLLMEAPVGPVFEHGRTAPIWVSSNRARALQSWQPPRAAESPQQASSD